LSEAEQKIYDLVTRRFMAVFFPPAQYSVTTRISTVAGAHHFKTEGKVLTEAGWLAIYGKEAASEISEKDGKDAKDGSKDGGDSKNQTLPAVAASEQPPVAQVQQKALKTRPPARYNEATLLGAMEGAGKLIDDDELREAMQEKGLGTPATRAAIIEGLLAEKYLLRDGRDIIPMPKAFQLMTLLRGLEVKELTQPQLTGQWEYKLAQMERGQLSRADFMQEIAAMTEHMVKKAKEFDRDTIPGDYATLGHACPNCGGQVQENYRRFACIGKVDAAGGEGCGFSMPKTPGGRTLAPSEADALLASKRIGPLEGFRSKAGWPFVAELQLVRDEEANNYKMEFDFGNKEEDTGELQDFAAQTSLGACPACGGSVFENATHFVCEKAVPTAAQPTPSCKFKSGKIILQQPVEAAQMQKLLATGKTDELDKFVSTRTRRPFKAMLAWSAEEGKVVFEFAPRADGKVFPRRGAAKTAAAKKMTAKQAPAKKVAAKKVAAKKASAEKKAKTPRTGTLQPSAALAAVIGDGQYGRGEATKKLWDYIKAQNLQDPKDKRTINADAKLQAVFDGQAQVNMFKLAGILGKHLS
jgi:DNA topoisomerase-3